MNLNDAPDRAETDMPLFPLHADPMQRLPTSDPRPLRKILLAGDPATLDDQDILALLFSAIEPPNRARQLARSVLAAFVTTARVLAAPVDRLERLTELTRTHIVVIKTAEALATRHARASLPNDLSPILDTYSKVIDYCRTLTAHRCVEEFHLLHLDIKNRLIRDELHQRGTINHTPVYAREVCLRALDIGSSAIIAVHNHPSGSSEPSRADITTTERLRDTLKLIEVTLHDHLIVTASDAFSFRDKGLL